MKTIDTRSRTAGQAEPAVSRKERISERVGSESIAPRRVVVRAPAAARSGYRFQSGRPNRLRPVGDDCSGKSIPGTSRIDWLRPQTRERKPEPPSTDREPCAAAPVSDHQHSSRKLPQPFNRFMLRS